MYITICYVFMYISTCLAIIKHAICCFCCVPLYATSRQSRRDPRNWTGTPLVVVWFVCFNTGHWKATGHNFRKFVWKILYTNLDLNPAPVHPPIWLCFCVGFSILWFFRKVPGCLPVASRDLWAQFRKQNVCRRNPEESGSYYSLYPT